MAEPPGNNLTQAFRQGLKEGFSGPNSEEGRRAIVPAISRGIWISAVAVAVIGFCLVVQPSDAEKTEDAQKGFHCLSGWDGSHVELVDQVRDNLRDPGSFEHVSTRVTELKPDGSHGLIMEYRARNGFGGMAIENVAATYRNSDCILTGWQAY